VIRNKTDEWGASDNPCLPKIFDILKKNLDSDEIFF